jgi:hypothetical protein
MLTFDQILHENTPKNLTKRKQNNLFDNSLNFRE